MIVADLVTFAEESLMEIIVFCGGKEHYFKSLALP